jgi:hypothetical protein
MDFRAVDLQNLVVPPLQKKDHGLSCKPLYRAPGSNAPCELVIQTPICRFPFGLSNNTEQQSYVQGTPIRYTVSASFDNYKENAIQKDFYNFATQMQEYAIHLAAHNSKTWFGEECDAKSARMLFNKWIKVPKGDNADKYDPTFRLSTRAKKDKNGAETGDFWTSLFDVDGSEINLRSLQNGAKGHMKIKLSSFYVIAGKFGWTWDVEWIRLTSRAQARADDYNANMYGESPAVPSVTYQDGFVLQQQQQAPPPASIYDGSESPTTTGGTIKREADEPVSSLETNTPSASATAGGAKRVKKAT